MISYDICLCLSDLFYLVWQSPGLFMLLQMALLHSFFGWVVFHHVVMYTYHIFFIHSSVDGHLDWFHVLATVNIAAIKIRVHISCKDIFPGVGLHDHMVLIFLVFQGTSYTTFVGRIYHPINSVAQSCPTLVNAMDCSMTGFPVYHQLPEFAQIHVHQLWYHPIISSSVIPFFSSLQSFPASGSFQMIQLFTSGGQSTGASASASVLPMNIQDWFPLGWTGWISLLSKGLSRVFSSTAVQKHQFFNIQLSLQSNSHIHTWLLEKSKFD